MPEVRLPKLADTLVEGTVSRWLKRQGERVAVGEPLVEIETDKVNSELESPYAGVVTEILVEEGATVPVGEVIARIEGEGAAEPGPAAEPEPESEAGEAGARPAGGGTPAAAGRGQPPGLDPLRRRIAERMTEARATVEQGACVLDVELAAAGARPGWTARFVRAVAAAGGYQDVGVAVEVPGGVVVPVVRGAARLEPERVAEVIADLAARARENRLSPAEVSGGEFTVTNVGSVGTLLGFPLVNPGQPGILAPGVIEDGRCRLTLCYDRAAMDEDRADALLHRVGAELAGTGR